MRRLIRRQPSQEIRLGFRDAARRLLYKECARDESRRRRKAVWNPHRNGAYEGKTWAQSGRSLGAIPGVIPGAEDLPILQTVDFAQDYLWCREGGSNHSRCSKHASY